MVKDIIITERFPFPFLSFSAANNSQQIVKGNLNNHLVKRINLLLFWYFTFCTPFNIST